jgi:hypothetical protein
MLVMLALIHPPSGKKNSTKVDFRFREFSEVREESCKKYCI